MKPHRPPAVCPICGTDVPPNAQACPECGACEKSGWSDEAHYDGVGLPPDDFDYLKSVGDDSSSRARTSAREWFVWIVALLVLVAFAWLSVHGR